MSGLFGDVLRMLSDVTEGPDVDISIADVDALGDISALVPPSPGDPLRNLSNSNDNFLKPDPKAAWLRGRKRRASSALSLGLDLDEYLPLASPPPRSSKKKSKSVKDAMTPKFLADMGLRKSLIDILNVFNPTDGADKSMAGIAESPSEPDVPLPGMADVDASGTDLYALPGELSLGVHAVTPQLDSPSFIPAVVPVIPHPVFKLTVPDRAPAVTETAQPSDREAAHPRQAHHHHHTQQPKLGANGRKRRNCGAATNPKLAATRNHVCDICQSRFLCKSKLDRHMRTHNGEKPFECYCGKTFNQKSALKNHSRRHIKKGDVPESMDMMNKGINGFSYASLIEKLI
eukprot:m.375517 g.375517  ORF g.375517 m.375517 type:complete len:345 (+) comp16698_c4_seq1:223-1257(+)